jgi:hypothetical protein
VPDIAVADAGGLLVLAGLVEGEPPDVHEVLALDATSLLVAEYIALRHEGAPLKARRDFGLVIRTVAEWFPVRALAMEAVLAAGDTAEVDGSASLALAESLHVALVTKNPDLSSDQVTVLHC